MKRISLSLCIVSMIVLLNSCIGTTTIMPTSQGVGVNQGNYEYVETLEATEKSVYVLGIGGMRSKQGALAVLYKKANLQPNEAIINVDYVRHTKTYFGIFQGLGLVTIEEFFATGQKIRFVGVSNVSNVSNVSPSQPKTIKLQERQTESVKESKETRLSAEIEKKNKFFYDFLCKSFDRDGDKELDDEELLDIETITMTKRDYVRDLDGIELLSNLKNLTLVYWVGKLDLSKNEKLESVTALLKVKLYGRIILPKDKDVKLTNISEKVVIR